MSKNVFFEKEKNAFSKAAVAADYLIESYLTLFGDCPDSSQEYNLASILSFVITKTQKDLNIKDNVMFEAISLIKSEWKQKLGYNLSCEKVDIVASEFAQLCRLAVAEEHGKEVEMTLSDCLDSMLSKSLKETSGVSPRDIIRVLELSLDHWKTKLGEF